MVDLTRSFEKIPGKSPKKKMKTLVLIFLLGINVLENLPPQEQILTSKIITSITNQGINLRSWESLNEQGLSRRADVEWGSRLISDINTLIIHHTDYLSIQRMLILHTQPGYFDNKGAPFIAYHFLILKDGTILWLNPLSQKVWHAKGANDFSIGIALHGNFNQHKPTSRQVDSLKILVATLKKVLPISQIKGHQELDEDGKKTECPGEMGMILVKKL